MKHKKTIILPIILLILISLITIPKIFNKKELNTTKENTIIYKKDPGITKDKYINNIIFTNIKFSIKNNITTISYVIKNNNDTKVTLNNYQLIFKDSNNNIIETLEIEASNELESKEQINIENTATINLKDTTNLEIILQDKEWLNEKK